MWLTLVALCLCGIVSADDVALQTTPLLKTLKHVTIRVDNFNAHTVYSVLRQDEVVQRVQLDEEFGRNPSMIDTPTGFELHGVGQSIHFDFIEDRADFTLIRVSRSLLSNQSVSDCISLDTGRTNWYGGPQIFHQYWPVEKLSLTDYSYVAKQQDNVGVAERYWLNSKGAFVYVDATAPLFLNQNGEHSVNQLCLTVQNKLPYNVRRSNIPFLYHIGVGNDVKAAHKEAVKHFLKKPTGVPDARMVSEPIWSTWARYKADINESIVEKFGDEILKHGFNHSQLEIDDDWEVCYGALTFRPSKFPNIKKFVDRLKARGFRVTLWVHPFINKGCEPWYTEAKNKGYFVVDHKNHSETQWWNSQVGQTGQIDFTKSAAAQWYTERLRKLQRESGIDSFKFDAGETSWSPPDPVLNSTIELHPTSIVTAYIKTVGKFGPLVEVRSAHGTQNEPIFLRMLDKDSEWTFDNGLPTLITTLLQLNLVGYPFVLPDMIGGNGYNNRPPTKELFIRWLQANVFMPSLQFSYVPWDYDNETIEISRDLTQLHSLHGPLINRLFKNAVATGEPVNVPIWWIDPQDVVAHQISDEFLLGEHILVAPVIEQGARSRHIYLPRGTWEDQITGATVDGPRWLMSYPAPLNVLPYFIRVDKAQI